MDGQQQFLKPTQHVPFYVKKPITLDTSSHPHLFGYENGSKPASYSVDLSHSRFHRLRHPDQLSEPYSKTQSKSLRDVFEKAILRGDVAIHSPDEENGVMRNPSFITASLPRPDKFVKQKQKSATIGGDNYVHIVKSHHRSRDYFIDSDSESDTDNGKHNEAYMDDASSTISDELFKSNSEGQAEHQGEEDFHIQALPQLLDIDSHQAGRSALGAFFKPKYRDYPRSNVHRTSERQHKEVIDSGNSRHGSKPRANSLHREDILHRDTSSLSINGRLDPTRDAGKLPRTTFPNHSSHIDPLDDEYTSQQRDMSQSPEMSHNRYLPKKRRSSRHHSPRPHSPGMTSRKETAFNELEDIVPASPELPRRSSRHISRSYTVAGEGRLGTDGTPLEQMGVEEAPWRKEERREERRRRRRKICWLSVVIGLILTLGGIGAAVAVLTTNEKGTGNKPNTNDAASGDMSSTTPFPVTSTNGSILTSPTTGVRKENITLTFDGSMRITSEAFTSDLDNLTSTRSQNLTNKFCERMQTVFDSSTSATTDQDYAYKDCGIKKFSNGSIIVDFELNLLRAPSSDDSAEVFKNILKNYFAKNGDFTIDPDSLTLEDTTTSTTTTTELPAMTTTIATSAVITATTATTATMAVEVTTSIPPTPAGCALVEMVDYGVYEDPTNCTRYLTCFPEDPRVQEIPCLHMMFVSTSPGHGKCKKCQPSVCDLCRPSRSSEDDSE